MNNNNEKPISFSAIFMGLIASLAILVTCGLFAMAVLFMLDIKSATEPSFGLLILASFGIGLMLLLSFFIAAYVANICTTTISGRSIFFHSLGVWSLLAMIISIGCLVSLCAINFQKIKSPFFVTEVHITKLSAVTRIDFPKDEQKEAAEEKIKNQRNGLIAWLTFISIFGGLLTSQAGGYCARKSKFLLEH